VQAVITDIVAAHYKIKVAPPKRGHPSKKVVSGDFTKAG